MVKTSRLFKTLLLACVLAAPNLAFNAMAAEADMHWSPVDVYNDGGGDYAYFDDANNWGSTVAPGYTNDAGAYIRVMDNQAVGSHVLCIITNDMNLYQIMIGAGGSGDVIITNGAHVTAGVGMFGGPNQWTGVGFPNGPSTLTIAGTGSSLTCGDHLWLGQGDANGGPNSVIVDGGTLTVTGQLGVSWNGGPGTNYLIIKNGGTVNEHSWNANQSFGQPANAGNVGILNIADNTSRLVINGNQTGSFNYFVTNGNFLAYGGLGTITYSYNPSLNVSTVTAIAPVDPFTPIFSLQPSNVVVMLGSPVTLHALVSNVSPVDYTWQLNNVPLVDGGGLTGTHTPNLSIASVAPANVGNYSVVATNHAHADHFTTSQTASVNAESFNLFPVITVNGIPGNTYAVQYATSLTPPVTWTTLATVTLGGASQQIVDTATPLAIKRFYQVVAQ
jgi:hypothetical protein